MTTIQVLGVIAAALFVSLLAGIAIGRTFFGDRVNDLTDEHAEHLGADSRLHGERR